MDITSGNFVFSASESYLIEDGKLTRPVKNATLIGNGPEALKYVSMVGNDLKLDEGIGDLRQGRAERAGGRGHSDGADRPDDGGRHGLSALLDSPSRRRGGAWRPARRTRSAPISEGEEFSAQVRLGEVETLKQAGSRGAGLRILTGQCTGSSYTSDLSAEGDPNSWCGRRWNWPR